MFSPDLVNLCCAKVWLCLGMFVFVFVFVGAGSWPQPWQGWRSPLGLSQWSPCLPMLIPLNQYTTVCVWMGTQVCCCVICTLSERLLTQPGWLEGRTLEWRCYQLCNNPQDHPSDTRTTGCCEYITQEITATGLHSSRGKSSVYGKQVHLV